MPRKNYIIKVIKVSLKVKAVKEAIVSVNFPLESLKFNVDGSTKDKLGLAGIGGVLRDNAAAVKIVFFKAIGVVESNVAELLVVWKVICIYASSR